MEMKANPAQEQVIKEIYGQVIVVACPGSGKTTTILRRIHHMIENEGISPEEILMITFTKAAATEMKEKYESKYGAGSGVTFCTIHSLCVAVLKKFAGFHADNILTNNHPAILNIIKNDRRSDGVDNLEQFAKDIELDITKLKNSCADYHDYFPTSCSDIGFFRDIYTAYEQGKQNLGLRDYDDLLADAYQIVKTNKACLDYLRDTYGFIHVDEYQDTNTLQRDFIYEIAGLNGNITVVGDDDQSIYGFRGANPDVMQDFLKHYPSAVMIKMGTNYRSDRMIIQHAAALIQCNQDRFEKQIVASSEQEGMVSIHTSASRKEMYVQACADVMKLSDNGDDSRIAMLFRTNSQMELMEDICLRYSVPFYGNEPLPDRYHDNMFYDIMAYYQMASGRFHSDGQEAFIRTVHHPNRFFRNLDSMYYTDTMEQMIGKTKAGCNTADAEESVSAIKKYHGLLCMIKLLPPLKAMDAIYTQGGYREYLMACAEYQNKPFGTFEDRWMHYKEDLEKNQIRSFDEWLEFAEEFSTMLDEQQSAHEGVCLSTIHKSKGLEWDHVLMLNCMEGSMPFAKTAGEQQMEEERRLFYVGMTRAKHDLKMYCHRPEKMMKAKPSRFLSDAGFLV